MWYLYSILAMVCLAVMVLIFKRLQAGGMPDASILFFVFGFGFVLYLSHSLITKGRMNWSPEYIAALLVAAFFSYLGNLLQLKAFHVAPNPGYVTAIIGSQALIISLASIYLFGSSLSLLNIAGLVLCVVGVALLSVK